MNGELFVDVVDEIPHEREHESRDFALAFTQMVDGILVGDS